MSRSSTRLSALLAGLWAASLSTPALSQAELHAQVGWTDDGKPRNVEFQQGSAEDRAFEQRPTYFLGAKTFDGVLATDDFVVRWPDASMTLRARAEVDAEPYFFRIARPDVALKCNNRDVNSLLTQSFASDHQKRIGLMPQMLVLLRRERGEQCSSFNKQRLASRLFQINCELGKDTEFFHLSPDVVSAYRGVYPRSTRVANRIRLCTDQINGKSVAVAYRAAKSASQSKDFDQFHALNDKLLTLVEDPDYSGAFTVQKIERHDLQHRKIEALKTQYDDFPDGSAEQLAVAEKLASLGNDPDYRPGFRQASFPVRTALQLPATVLNERRRLEAIDMSRAMASVPEAETENSGGGVF